jgi:hypothetical protein
MVSLLDRLLNLRLTDFLNTETSAGLCTLQLQAVPGRGPIGSEIDLRPEVLVYPNHIAELAVRIF